MNLRRSTLNSDFIVKALSIIFLFHKIVIIQYNHQEFIRPSMSSLKEECKKWSIISQESVKYVTVPYILLKRFVTGSRES